MQNNKGFTLVELIVVIAILGILWTIAFISLFSYLETSRDAKRVSTIKTISTWLELYYVESHVYPDPDNSTSISFDTNSLWYQWTISDWIISNLEISEVPLDPTSDEEYIYSVNQEKSEYSILWFLEDEDFISNLSTKVFADNSYWNPKVFYWKDVPVLTNVENNIPISWTDIDVWGSEKDNVYNIFLWDREFTWSGFTVLSAFIWNNKNMVSLDENMIWYWDMETKIGNKLKDFTNSRNHLSSYSYWHNSEWWPEIWASQWINGSSTYFSWSTYFSSPVWTWSLNHSWSITISSWFKLDSLENSNYILSMFDNDSEVYNKYISSSDQQFKFFNWTWYSQSFDVWFGDWYHSVVSYDPYWRMRVYVNWVKIPNSWYDGYSSDWPFTITENAEIYLWAKELYWWFFNWNIDEVKIWDRILTEEEVSILNYMR